MAGRGGYRSKNPSLFDKGVQKFVNFFDLSPDMCKLPGCNKPRYIENNGRPYDFCGKSHAEEYRRAKEEEERMKLMQNSKRRRFNAPNNQLSTHAVTTQAASFPGIGRTCGGPSHAYPSASFCGANVVGQPNNNVTTEGPIRFYNRDEPYYAFTNFYPAPIVVDGKQWPTTEHYFQAQKFIGTPFTEVIRNFQRPREAFDLSRKPAVSRWRRKDWEEVKVDIMRKALLAKFTQHRDLRQLLLKTKDNMLIEHTPYDNFWGDGGDGNGQNKLGMLLMEIRFDLKNSRKLSRSSSVETATKVCREVLQRSTSIENGSPIRSSGSSSSLMDQSNVATDGKKNHKGDLCGKPDETLQQLGSSNDTLKHQSSPQSRPQLPADGGQQTNEVPVANLIDLNEAEHEKTDADRLLMADQANLPESLDVPIQPASLTLTNSQNTALESHTNTNKKSALEEPDKMDTTVTIPNAARSNDSQSPTHAASGMTNSGVGQSVNTEPPTAGKEQEEMDIN